jgi:hypothetical protein
LQRHVSRAYVVLFPVDCISHAAMSLIKRLCRQSGKPFLALCGAVLRRPKQRISGCSTLRSRERRLIIRWSWARVDVTD